MRKSVVLSIVILLLWNVCFANVFVVFSYQPTGYPWERRKGMFYILDIFDDYQRALYLMEEIKQRTGKEVYVGNFKSRENLEDWMWERNREYLYGCIREALRRDFSYPGFNQDLFKEDLRGILRELSLKPVREAMCYFETLEEFVNILEGFSYNPRVKLVLEDLRRFIKWRDSTNSSENTESKQKE